MKIFQRKEAFRDPLIPQRSGFKLLTDCWINLNPFWKTSLVLILLALLLLPFYKPLKSAWDGWREDRDLVAAKKALADGHNDDARDLSINILRRNPKNRDALPILLHAAASIRDESLVSIARSYLGSDTRDKSDRLFAWKAISTESPMGIAGITWLGSLREDERSDPEFLVFWLERLQSEKLYDEVRDLLVKQNGIVPSRMEQIRLSQLARRGTEDSYRELQARLFDRLASQPKDCAGIVGVLDDVPQSSLIPYSFIGLEDWLKTQGEEPSVENRLRLVRCEMVSKPEEAEAILTRTTRTFASTNPLLLAKLFFTLDRYDQAENLLKTLDSKGDLEVFSLLTKVFERQGKLGEWEKLLEDPPESAFLPGVLCDRVFIAAQKGDERARTKFEQEALIIAEKRLQSDSMIQLAKHASDRGLHEYALEVWVKAIRMGPSTPLPLFASISPVFERLANDKRENQLLEILTVYRVAEPGNLDVIIQHLYLSCLVGSVTPKQLLSVLLPLKEKFSSHALDLTISLAHILENQPDLAAKLTDDNSIDWFSEVPAYRAIRSITLTKTSRKEEADVYLEDFPWEVMLPCEKRVFKEMLETPRGSTDTEVAEKQDKIDRSKIAEGVRQAQKAKELMKIRNELKAKESAETEEQKVANRAQKAEAARLAEQAHQAKRAAELKEIREKLAARATKEATEAANFLGGKDESSESELDGVEIIKRARQGTATKEAPAGAQ